jgi:hypothetical protein
MRRRARRLIWMIPAAIVGMALFIFVGGEIVKLLWNWLLPSLFGWRMITFWQGLGILVLCRILFGHHGFRHGGGRYYARRRIRERMAERWEQMTPEEREKMRRRWRGYCGGFEPPPETTPGA